LHRFGICFIFSPLFGKRQGEAEKMLLRFDYLEKKIELKTESKKHLHLEMFCFKLTRYLKSKQMIGRDSKVLS